MTLYHRGGKDFFVLVLEQLMFVKGTGKHWCKYPTCVHIHSVGLTDIDC